MPLPIPDGPVFTITNDDYIPPTLKRTPSFKISDTDPKKRQNPWTLDEALRLVRGLQGEVKKFGFHLCLGGGVLNTGLSHHDVDLYFLPLGNTEVGKVDDLVVWLEGLWGTGVPLGEGTTKSPKTRMSFSDFIRQTDPTLVPPPPPKKVYPPSDVYRKRLAFQREDGRIEVFII